MVIRRPYTCRSATSLVPSQSNTDIYAYADSNAKSSSESTRHAGNPVAGHRLLPASLSQSSMVS